MELYVIIACVLVVIAARTDEPPGPPPKPFPFTPYDGRGLPPIDDGTRAVAQEEHLRHWR
ncbi:MAG: hypothetical protein U0797_01015 [Gemmataceae bacterium]